MGENTLELWNLRISKEMNNSLFFFLIWPSLEKYFNINPRLLEVLNIGQINTLNVTKMHYFSLFTRNFLVLSHTTTLDHIRLGEVIP